MGTDITDFLEVRAADGTWNMVAPENFPLDEPFDQPSPLAGARNYAMFALLADVRNYTGITPISQTRGLPADVSDRVRAEVESGRDFFHDSSWLTLAELLAVDYEQPVHDRDGSTVALREFVGEWFTDRLQWLRTFGDPQDVRIVFCFDT